MSHKVTPLPTPSADEHDAMTVGDFKRILKDSGSEKLFMIEGGERPIMTVAITGEAEIQAVLLALHNSDLIDGEQMANLWNRMPTPVQA